MLPTAEVPEQYRWRDMVIWAGEKTHLVHYPLRSGEFFNLVAVFHCNRYEEGWDSFGDPAELHERFAETCEPVRTLLGKIETGACGCCATARRSRNGAAAASRSWAMPRIRCCNIWRRAPAWRSRTRSASPTRWSSARGDFAAAFRAYQEARYLRTGRVQIMARVYGEVYHASGVAKELRNMCWRRARQRTPWRAWSGSTASRKN